MTQPKEISVEQAMDSTANPDLESIEKAMKALAGTPARSMRDIKESATPPWAIIPSGLELPKGQQVIFLKFKAAWTLIPSKGDRQAIAWPITVGDEKNAAARARGSIIRNIDELAKSMVRCIDGFQIDWTGANPKADIDIWWNEIGPKCRNLVLHVYNQTHNLNDEEYSDFFENCVTVRTVV